MSENANIPKLKHTIRSEQGSLDSRQDAENCLRFRQPRASGLGAYAQHLPELFWILHLSVASMHPAICPD